MAFVEAVNLVDEKDSLLTVHAEVLLGFFDNGFHVFFAGYGGVDLGEFSAGSIGDNFCQSSLSGSRRTVEDDRGQFICFDSSV